MAERLQPQSDGAKTKKSFLPFKPSDIFTVGGFDIPFFAIVMALITVGLIMLFSASYPYALQKYDNSYHYFIRQFIFAVIGIDRKSVV